MVLLPIPESMDARVQHHRPIGDFGDQRLAKQGFEVKAWTVKQLYISDDAGIWRSASKAYPGLRLPCL
jgi:hypothetical protein